MADESKVRLVRCPKCESMIQELPEFSVYKCGSCGAVLRAKKKGLSSNGSLDNATKEGRRGDCAKVDSQLDKGGSLSLRSVSETEICGVEAISRKKERTFGEKSSMNSNNVSSIVDKEKIFLEENKNRREQRYKHSRAEKEAEYVDNNIPSSKNPMKAWAQRDEQDVSMYRSKSVSVNSSRETKFVDHSPRLTDFARSLRLKGVKDTPGADRVGFYRRSLRTIDEQNRFSAFHYPDEGPSSYRCGSIHCCHKPGKSSEYPDVPNGVQNFEKDRAQLLKKLEELKDQLSRSHDMPRRCREPVPSDYNMASTDPLGGSTGNHRSAQSHHVSELTYSNYSSMNDLHDHVQNIYGDFHPALKHVGYKMPCYGDSLSPDMRRRPIHHRDRVSLHDPQQRTYGYSSWQYMDFINKDSLSSYLNPEETLYHRPACSCSHCCDKDWKGSMQVPPTGFTNRRFLKDPCNSTFNHYLNSDGVGEHYLPRAAKCPQLNFQDPAVHVWPSDIDSDIDSFARRCPRSRRRVLNCRNKQLSQPIAGGAPFITCYNCLEVLKLPRKLKEVIKNDHRLRCGACSTVIVFEMEKKGLTVSVPKSSKMRSTEAKEKSSELLNENHPSSSACFNASGNICTSSNVENSGYDQTSSMENQSPDSVINWKDSPGFPERPFSNDVSLAVSSFPFQEQVKNPSSYESVSGHRKENMTKLEQQEKAIPVVNATQNAPVATQVEVSFSGYLSTPSSQNSLEASKEENQLKLHKGSKSFLVGLIRKSFGDFSRSNDNFKNERPTVSVNGQPISDSAVRSAEKQAGPIQPGSYWYDSQAGFWGVMGQPCSGIVPPFIEEFNYPMSENCAAGNTGVFINGRELHQKDLDMLACKGLPTTRDKRYIIEISGRVLDQGTGKQLYSLGKLAPTVEKEKRGFGMQVPCAVERSRAC